MKKMSAAIVRDPEIMHGTPVFVARAFPYRLSSTTWKGPGRGDTLEIFLEGFPTVSRELALRSLDEAKDLLLARA